MRVFGGIEEKEGRCQTKAVDRKEGRQMKNTLMLQHTTRAIYCRYLCSWWMTK
jgi:hypothetical protein